MLLLFSIFPLKAARGWAIRWIEIDTEGVFGGGPHGFVEWASALFFIFLLALFVISLGQAAYLFVCAFLELCWKLIP